MRAAQVAQPQRFGGGQATQKLLRRLERVRTEEGDSLFCCPRASSAASEPARALEARERTSRREGPFFDFRSIASASRVTILSIFIVCVSSLKLLIYPFSETCCAQLTCTSARTRDTPTRARSRPRHHVRHRLAHRPRRRQGGQVRRLQPRHARLAGTRARGLQNAARSRSDTSRKPQPGSRACGGTTPARPSRTPLFSRPSPVSIAAYVTRSSRDVS